MAIKKKVFQKKMLKEPDEFITLFNKTLKWVVDNSKFLLVCIAVVLVTFLISFNYVKGKEIKEKKAYSLFYKGLSEYDKLSNKYSEDDINKLLELFENTIKKFPNTKGAKYALLYKGHLFYKNSKYEKAAEIYKKVLGTSSEKNKYNIAAKEGLAYSKFALKKYKDAITIFKQIVNSNNVLSKRDIQLAIADVYESMKDKSSAIKILKKFLVQFPDDPETSRIENRIEILSK